ncbi:hypothetical protein LOK49_LG12G03039 [Camellia lanceoleosa]|uniref:Uncharacterized protein n=1 Tax=Camellia lanceoleosa TaxID=1840588 RepID=A0ACC0FTB8_9ERIC|nr:hypothetical protein LOK49_LG12G03039 [Camellia lanceoleosa]
MRFAASAKMAKDNLRDWANLAWHTLHLAKMIARLHTAGGLACAGSIAWFGVCALWRFCSVCVTKDARHGSALALARHAGGLHISYSLFDGICYSDNRSNSRANTCNKPRLLEGMHLLDKRLTRAMPVALMIHDNSTNRTALVPAMHHSNFCPINFRCWILGWVDRSASGVHQSSRPFCCQCAPGLNWPGRASGAVTLKKLECSKQAYALDTLAWDNIIGFRSYYVGLRDRSND